MSYQVPYNTARDHHDVDTYQNSQDHVYDPYHQHYTDEQPGDQNQGIYNNYPPAPRAPTSFSQVNPVRRMTSEFEEGEFPDAMAPSGSKSQTRKDYRYNRQGNLCTKGGRVRCIGRICCCSLMTTVFLIVSIVLALALWIRPPSIIIGSVQTQASSIQKTTNGFSFSLGVGISVSNPNYFSVDLTKSEAELFYPINNTAIGGGNTSDIVFKSRSQTNFTFPFELSYSLSDDAQHAILSDIAAKCGVNGTKSNLNINYKIKLSIRFLVATISPVISNTFSFACPISASDISQLLSLLE